MLKTIEIRYFKSIEQLKINCKRINVFIGEPNTGKSNILEAIGVFSMPYCSNLRELVRFENMSDLFFEKETRNKAAVRTDLSDYSISYEEGKVKIDLNYGKGIKINYVTDDKGNLLPCLGAHYLGFSNSIRLDIMALTDLAKKNQKKPTPKQLLEIIQGKSE